MAMSALILTLLLTLFNFIGFVLQQVWNFIAGFFHALFLLVVSPREGAMHLGMWFCRYGGVGLHRLWGLGDWPSRAPVRDCYTRVGLGRCAGRRWLAAVVHCSWY